MRPGALRVWQAVHRWTALACTVFLLLVCLTGLPLLFGDEIEAWLAGRPAVAPLAHEVAGQQLDRIVAQARARYPEEVVSSVIVDAERAEAKVYMVRSWAAYAMGQARTHWIGFDARSGEPLDAAAPQAAHTPGFMATAEALHTRLLAGEAGRWFLTGMALLFVAAIVSGGVLYAPYMRTLAFGTVRRERSRRLKWLDRHNLLGIATLVWALVVGATGAMNELASPLFGLWQRTDIDAVLAPWQGDPPLVLAGDFASVRGAYDTARDAVPGGIVRGIDFPGALHGSPQHYLVWTVGATPATSRLSTPVLVDARHGTLTVVLPMPWYLRAVELSRPLHFGDYGGLPLKVLWALLDIATLVVLASGLYLWGARRGGRGRRERADA